MEIRKIHKSQINPAPYNPRKDLQPGDSEYDKLARSIETFGDVEPLVWNKRTGNLVSGHQRLKILLAQGREEFDVSVVNLDDVQEKQLNIVLNKISGDWDQDKLTVLLNEISELADVTLTGFDWEEIDNIIDSIIPIDVDIEDDEYEIKLPIVSRSKIGEIYQLGEHRLMCGDSTKAEDVKKLMNGQLADLLLTDPPYNVNYEGATEDKLTIMNDCMSDEEFLQFLTDAFSNAQESLRTGAAFYIWHSDSKGYDFRLACKTVGWTIRQCLVWTKNTMVLGRQDYQWKHEPCLYGWTPGSAHKWYSDRSQTTVLDFDKPLRNAEHPTMKPVELFAYLIGNSSQKGDIVLDLFGGSGTTMIACEQLKRKAYLMEYDPKYVDVIIDRWETLTGQKAVKVKK